MVLLSERLLRDTIPWYENNEDVIVNGGLKKIPANFRVSYTITYLVEKRIGRTEIGLIILFPLCNCYLESTNKQNVHIPQ